MDFSSLQNSVWTIILTVTTVGYGDYYPRTILGRAIVLLACIWGCCFISQLVVTLVQVVEMSDEEKMVSLIKS